MQEMRVTNAIAEALHSKSEMKSQAFLLALIAAITLLNAAKPLVGDDFVYYEFAAHIAGHPLDPYGFKLSLWSSATGTLVPLGLPYYLAAMLHVFGDNPFFLKLALLPFVVVLVGSVQRLARRFAPTAGLPLVAMTVLSPAFLPSWNLMLDLPALALSISAILVSLEAIDTASRRSRALKAIAAGLLLGAAAQVKYTAFVVPGVMLLYGIINRRPGPSLIAAGTAGSLFVAVETLLAYRYGRSPFLAHLGARFPNPIQKVHLILPLVSILGGVASWVALMELAALGVRQRVLAGLAVFIATGYLLLAVLPEHHVFNLRPEMLFYGTTGALVVGAGVMVLKRLLESGHNEEEKRDDLFLIGWLGLEIVGYFALSPFPAARRVLGIVLVAALIAGRLLERTDLARCALRAWAVATAAAALGGLFFLVDFREARARKDLAERSAQWIRQRDPQARIWVFSCCGFAFYAEREGMQDLPLERTAQAGEWIVEDDVFEKLGGLSPSKEIAPVERLVYEDRLPLRTYGDFYVGGSPLQHLFGARAYATIYRVPEGSSGVASPVARR
jgi:hypothetical protein